MPSIVVAYASLSSPQATRIYSQQQTLPGVGGTDHPDNISIWNLGRGNISKVPNSWSQILLLPLSHSILWEKPRFFLIISFACDDAMNEIPLAGWKWKKKKNREHTPGNSKQRPVTAQWAPIYSYLISLKVALQYNLGQVVTLPITPHKLSPFHWFSISSWLCVVFPSNIWSVPLLLLFFPSPTLTHPEHWKDHFLSYSQWPTLIFLSI